MALWVAVHGLTDGQDMSADTFNRPLYELAERTNYLHGRLQELTGSAFFESVRIHDAPLLASGSLAPSVRDVVCLDVKTGFYVKAVASMSLLDEFSAADSAFAIGVLVDKVGNSGTVAIYGRFNLSSNGASWRVSDLLEHGEKFRNGQYFLSSTEPGKLTAHPAGPTIRLGYFMRNTENAALGDYAIVNPQHRDTGESHAHRAFKIHTQPVGRQHVTEDNPNGVHLVIGFRTLAVETDSVEPGDRIPRLVCSGVWTGQRATQYTIWLSTISDVPRTLSRAPLSFAEAYLCWESSDLLEGSGRTPVRSFEDFVPIGTKGLRVCLENPSGYTPRDGTRWDVPYEAASDVPDKRTWSISVPTDTVGWCPRYWRQRFEPRPSADGKFSMLLMGGPHTRADRRSSDTIFVKCAEIYEFDTVFPNIGETTRIGDAVFEYVDSVEDAAPGNIPVLRTGDAANPVGVYVSLLSAVLGLDNPAITPVLDEEAGRFLVGVPASTVVSHRGSVISRSAQGAGTVAPGGGNASFLIHDRYNRNLVEHPVSRFWVNAEAWRFVSLKNNLQALPIPFDTAGAGNVDLTASIGDSWVCELSDTAPGSQFVYAIGMHAALAAYYPPIPSRSAALVLNGVELDSNEFFDDNSTYTLAPDSIHWRSRAYGFVPWPADWSDGANRGSSYLAQKMLFHFVRGSAGNSGHVTSIRPAPGAPIRVLKCGTREPGVVGDLEVDLDLELSAENGNIPGFQVVKSTDGGKLLRGPVVEKLLVGAGLSMTQSGNAPPGQGIVTIGLSGGDDAYTGDFEEVVLENAKQETIGMFPYVRLLGWETGGRNTPTGFTAKFRVPHTVADDTYRVVLYATMFGEESVEFEEDALPHRAGLTFTYAVLPDVFSVGPGVRGRSTSNLVENVISPRYAHSVAVPMGDTSDREKIYRAFDPMLLHNNPNEPDAHAAGRKAHVFGSPFPNIDDVPDWSYGTLGVRPGSLVAIRLERADLVDPTREYTGALGFLNLRWLLVRVEE